MYYTKRATIKSYQEAVTWFSKCRTPDAGRALKSWCRVYKVGDAFEFRGHYNITFAVLTPDDVLTLPCSLKELTQINNTLSQASFRVLPIFFVRIATGRYAVAHSKDIDNVVRAGGTYRLRREGPEYFAGIQFDMNTGKCLNQRPRLSDCVNEAKRKLWFTKLRKFRQGIKVREKMGVLQGICDQVAEERARISGSWVKPDWDDEKWICMLHDAIRDEQFPTNLLRGFVMSSAVSYWWNAHATPTSTMKAIDFVLNKLSVELRKRFGVFEQDCDEEAQ